jgi:hypothetical protein
MRRNWLKARTRERVIVYTTEDQVLDGCLSFCATDGLVLIDTRVRSDNDVHLPGDIYVPREKIRIIQVVR